SRLGPGIYSVYAQCVSGGRLLTTKPVEVTLTDSDAENLILSLAPGPEIKDITGKVEWTAPTPPLEQRKGLTVRLGRYTAEVVPEGTFKIKDVIPERYEVDVTPLPMNGYIKAVRLGETLLAPDRILDLRSGIEDAVMRITLSANGGRVTGWITEGKRKSPAS